MAPGALVVEITETEVFMGKHSFDQIWMIP